LDLTYNPTIHADVPRHQRLSPAEKLAQLEEMRVRITDLPLLRADDPIAKYYGWDAGDLIRVYRPTSTLGGMTINYRAVIAPFSSQLISTGGDEPGPSHTTMDMTMEHVSIPDVKPDREIDYLHYN
jgi:DNA-directed RNA polymerase subunit H (RpoH/RPB5)